MMYYHKIISVYVFIIVTGLFFIQCSSSPEAGFRDSIIPVEQWGGERYTGDYPEHELQYITLHHGGVSFLEDDDPAEYLRNLQAWSRSDRDWIDIPYHYLIDLDGNIYEGRDIRYAGDTNTDYDPTGHALVCLLGNYEEAEPNEQQLQAIVNIFTWLCAEYNISPVTLQGHNYYAHETVCPGEHLYRYIEDGTLLEQIKHNISN